MIIPPNLNNFDARMAQKTWQNNQKNVFLKTINF